MTGQDAHNELLTLAEIFLSPWTSQYTLKILGKYIALNGSKTLAHYKIPDALTSLIFVHIPPSNQTYSHLPEQTVLQSFTRIHTQLHLQADTVYHRSIVCLWLSNPLMFYFCHALTFEIIACPSDTHSFPLTSESNANNIVTSYHLATHRGDLCVTHSTCPLLCNAR